MGRAELAAHARLTLRHHRKAESRNKDAFLQQHVTHLYGGGRFPDDDWDDRRVAGEGLEPGFNDLLAKVTHVFAQLSHSIRVRLEETDGSECTRCNRRRERIGKKLRPRTLSKRIAKRSSSGDKSTSGAAECFA